MGMFYLISLVSRAHTMNFAATNSSNQIALDNMYYEAIYLNASNAHAITAATTVTLLNTTVGNVTGTPGTNVQRAFTDIAKMFATATETSAIAGAYRTMLI